MSVSFKNVLKKHAAKLIFFVGSCIVLSVLALSAAFASPMLIKVNERITELKENIEATQQEEKIEEKEKPNIKKFPVYKEVEIPEYTIQEETETQEETTTQEEPTTLIEEELITQEASTFAPVEETENQTTEPQTEAQTEPQTQETTEPETTTAPREPETKPLNPSTSVQQELMSQAEKEVLRILNAQRAANGIKPLVLSSDLQRAAEIRVREIFVSFSHTRPNGESCYSIFPQDCNWKGENIAMGHKNPEQVMNGWMKSEGHRANILNPKFTHVGIGALTIDGKSGWVQCFGQYN